VVDANLFATTKQSVSLHVRIVWKEGELPRDSVVKESLTTAADGKQYRTKLFGLEMILAVGYGSSIEIPKPRTESRPHSSSLTPRALLQTIDPGLRIHIRGR
jgi:hypothetical protein